MWRKLPHGQSPEWKLPMSEIGRRKFLTLLSGAAATWPLTAGAQQSAIPLIGYIGAESPTALASRVRAFRQGLGELDMPKVEMSRSNFAAQRANTVDYLRWRRTWWVIRLP